MFNLLFRYKNAYDSINYCMLFRLLIEIGMPSRVLGLTLTCIASCLALLNHLHDVVNTQHVLLRCEAR